MGQRWWLEEFLCGEVELEGLHTRTKRA
jgi:hypothetical protein